jgi:hypothetical protein
MALDFQQVREQVRQLGENAPSRERRLKTLREQACDLLQSNAHELDRLRDRVAAVVQHFDPSLRCALPAREPLTAHFSPPALPGRVTVLAADGSQIYMDRHAPVEYFLINIGAIQACYGEAQPARLSVESDLQYGDHLRHPDTYFSEEKISLLRDLREREKLAELAEQAPRPVLTLTDGPMELWGAKSGDGVSSGNSLDAYLEALVRLHSLGATAAGYVDKPSEDYVVRLLEIASQPEEDAKKRPLFGVRDVDLFGEILAPGERSAVFEFQSRFAHLYKKYNEALALKFFYLNVGWEKHAWLARVETLSRVGEDEDSLNTLHAVLVHQCRIMGTRPYPYLLHRAHETALVSIEDKRQLETMIENELRKHGISGEISHKQGLKNLPGKGRYSR